MRLYSSILHQSFELFRVFVAVLFLRDDAGGDDGNDVPLGKALSKTPTALC